MKLTKGMFICFTGIDGSGKSTLAQRMVVALEQKGIKSKYVYSRFQPLLTKPLIWIGRSIFLHQKDAFKDYNEYVSRKRRLFKNRLLSLIYEHLLLLDYFFQVMIKVNIPLIIGKNIVCDRYVYDTIISDLAVDINYSLQKIDRMLKGLFLIIPKPHFLFLIDVPEEIAYNRKTDVPSMEYLRQRRKLYIKIGKEHKMIVLDGSKNLEELQLEVENKVLQ
ncbi:MAG: hypothetical protein QXD95_03560 [Nitrososphaeria archaeon]